MDSVAIIGAGLSGLSTAKSMLDAGLRPVIFEKADSLGGLWRSPKTGFVWQNMRTNLSKLSCSFSDYPWPKDTEDFPNQAKVREYLCGFAQKFLSTIEIRLETEVLSLDREGKFWVIESRSVDQLLNREQFQFCVVASGIFSMPNWPSIENLPTFNKVIHASEYCDPSDYNGERVLVVGTNFTGAGIATDLVGHAKSVSVACSSRAAYYMPLYFGKKPWDVVTYNQAAQRVKLPNDERHRKLKSFEIEGIPWLRPDLSAPPRVVPQHGNFKAKIHDGSIKTFPPLKVVRRNSSTVVFQDGKEADFDVIILATGYRTNLSFLSEDLKLEIMLREDDLFQPTILYKTVWPETAKNLGFIGMYRGPYFVTVELQGRWCAKVFSKQIPSPEKTKIEEGIREELALRQSSVKPPFPKPDYVGFSNEIAREMGEYPSDVLDNSNHKYHKALLHAPTEGVHYRSDILQEWLQSHFVLKDPFWNSQSVKKLTLLTIIVILAYFIDQVYKKYESLFNVS